MLVLPSLNPDLSVELFGMQHSVPVVMAPIGVLSIIHEGAEKAAAAAAADLRVGFTLSSASSTNMEDVAAASGQGQRWFQLYWPGDLTITSSILRRARAAGYTALVVTLDTPSIGWRPADLDNAYLPFPHGIGNAIGFSDPVYRQKFHEAHGKEIEEDILTASLGWQKTQFPKEAHRWEEIASLREHWDGPIVLKGIQHVDDARRAIEVGASGIVVRNHGGRQLDGAVGSLNALPEICAAVGDQIPVLFDSGIRTGADIVKALALGAKAVLVGRPWVWGLAINGQDGVRDALRSILCVSISSSESTTFCAC